MLHNVEKSTRKVGLVGYTGFVGSTLMRTMEFTHLYNSKNIETIKNESFDTLIFSGSKRSLI
jgi:aspartate-semialdehyde dehydrogenase